jgi:hypothetical protein
VGEVAKYIAVIESCHGDFRDDHLQERREGREDTELVMIKTETSSSRIVATLHDTGRNENFGVLLVDHLQTSGSLEIALEMLALIYT